MLSHDCEVLIFQETNEGYAAIGVGLPGAGIEEESNNTFFYSFEGG